MGVKQQIKEAVELAERGFDKNIRICVTGLSGSGKTAFITSLINQMLHQKKSSTLPFWLAHAEERIIAVKQTPYNELHIPEFPYQDALTAIEQGNWPESTSSISQVRLSIKYKIKHRWLRKFQSHSHLNIDIVDYPGEWLLDLPLLNQSFDTWCKSSFEWLQTGPQSKYSNNWLKSIQSIEAKELNDTLIKQYALEYRELLIACKNQSDKIHSIQPGRFVLPGELDGAPVLDFFPLPPELLVNSDSESYRLLEQKFNYYRDQVVKPFFKEYFSKVDRQLLLVDALKVLNQGFDSYKDLQLTLTKLITSFNYGQTNWLKRMFQPKINKLIIASSKSDHVPPEQHKAMQFFVTNMLRDAENQVGYQGVDVGTLIFSAIQVTEPLLAVHEKTKLPCVKGIGLSSKKEVVNYPGKILLEPMSKSQWREQEYNFINFALPELSTDNQLPHHRMDRLIEMLVGDKFL